MFKYIHYDPTAFTSTIRVTLSIYITHELFYTLSIMRILRQVYVTLPRFSISSDTLKTLSSFNVPNTRRLITAAQTVIEAKPANCQAKN